MTDIAKSITDKLAELGTEPDEIAERLREQGISGCGRDGNQCPLYHYLAEIFPGVSWVRSEIVEFAGGAEVDLPDPAREFIRAYDGGAYRFLRAVQP